MPWFGQHMDACQYEDSGYYHCRGYLGECDVVWQYVNIVDIGNLIVLAFVGSISKVHAIVVSCFAIINAVNGLFNCTI